jgi:predicted dehydrogenase/threonine dehydrogenase-like Zn-dependent dehydrogenase
MVQSQRISASTWSPQTFPSSQYSMRQIISNLKTGATVLEEVPAPTVQAGHLLIRTSRSLVSQGTERMLVQFGKASLFRKARSQPEKVKQVLEKIRTDGLLPTIDAVFRRLDEPLPLGYCNAGVVVAVGDGPSGSNGRMGGAHDAQVDSDLRLENEPSRHIRQFKVGDRVASNGPHAEVVSVPANLVAKIPDNVSDDAAAFTVIGAIGLQGIRLAKPELGETFVVVGLGLIGQITVQLLKAHGCRVIGFDYDPAKVVLARTFGVLAMQAGGELDPVKWVIQNTGGLGADGVVITASTSSNDVISQSARMCRKRGRIILIGVVGLNINRSDFYEKELTFQVSCSYGPGRYDDVYEEKGYDYPPAFVRWTEQRNFEAVLTAMATGQLDMMPLISRRVPLERFAEIYDNMDGRGLASLLVYDGGAGEPGEQSPVNNDRELVGDTAASDRLVATSDRANARAPITGQQSLGTTIRINDRQFGPTDGALAVIGAGNFTKMTALPALCAAKAPIKIIVSASGVTGTSLARKYDIPLSSTDYQAVLADPDIHGVIITTRHDLHAQVTIAALKAGKHVLVEKPLCLNLHELERIQAVLDSQLTVVGDGEPPKQKEQRTKSLPTLTVGFNRRFSAHARKIHELLGDQPAPLSLVATMNAGAIPLKHWLHDPDVGGGRLVGEACHFIDFTVFVTGSLVADVCATGLGGGGAPAGDTASIMLRHANGSTSVINYFANGSRDYPKERVEIFTQERVLVLDDFRCLTGFGFKRFSRLKTRQDKGHAAQFAGFARGIREGGPPLIPWAEIANVSRATLAMGESIRTHGWVNIPN